MAGAVWETWWVGEGSDKLELGDVSQIQIPQDLMITLSARRHMRVFSTDG